MSLSKEVYIRYKLIDIAIKNLHAPYPSMEDLLRICNERLGKDLAVCTIQRDIKAMKEDEELGFMAPIKFSKSKNGYYYSDPGYSISKVPLQENEIEALISACEIIQIVSGSRVGDSFNSAVKKIMVSLMEESEEKEVSIPMVHIDLPPKQLGWEHFDFILNAIKMQNVISFIHYSYRNNEFNANMVHPYQLKEFNNYWYLIGLSEKDHELKTFSLDQIYDPMELSIKYNYSKMEEVRPYNENMYGVYPINSMKKRILKFQCSAFMAKFLSAHPMHESQKIIKSYAEGNKIFSVELIPTRELEQWFFANRADVMLRNKDVFKNENISMFHNLKMY
ncbi:MAG: WYL domain-containing protein [Bacteroidetes bacterium]|nr:WYL domain-containing protein [Bacteroidota bacterium]